MEIRVNIPQNTYQKPTQVREYIVQAICDYLLRVRSWEEKNNKFFCYDKEKNRMINDRREYDKETTEKPHECEMQCAFDCLIKAGYNIFGSYCIGRGYEYHLSEKDFYKDEWGNLYNMVTKFNCRLD